MDLIARLLSTPVVAQFLAAPVIVACAVQCHLGPRTRALEGVRQWLWLRARGPFRLVGGYTTERTTADEYVCSVETSPDELERHLWRRGFHRNVVAAKKYRRTPTGIQWSESSWVRREHFWADDQLHVTLFRGPTGVDCYVHSEPSNVARPLDHWCGREQVRGDSERTFRAVLDEAGVERRWVDSPSRRRGSRAFETG